MGRPRVFPRLDPAINAEPLARKRLIVFSPSARNYLRFDGDTFRACAEQLRDEISARAPRESDFQEVIIGDDWHRIALDLDYDLRVGVNTSDFARARDWFWGAIREIICAAIDVYYHMFDDVISARDFIVCESIDPREPARMGAHIIIARMVPNYRVAAHMTDLIIRACDGGRDSASIGDEESHRAAELIDRAINATRHNLRCAECVKPGSLRIKRAPPDVCFADTFVGAPARRVPEDRAEYWVTASRRAVNGADVAARADVTRACELIDAKYGRGVHRFRRQCGAIVTFDRLRASDCELCGRAHDKDNTVIVAISRAPGGETYYREQCRHNLAERGGGAILLEATRDDDGIDDALARAEAPIASLSSWESRIARAAYAEPNMRDYPRFIPGADNTLARTVFVRAPMKLGKTKALSRYVGEWAPGDARVVFVSFRRTFSDSLAQRFPDFSRYDEIKGALDAPRMIVQVESLHRIAPDKLGEIDLLILDESESVLDQFDSGLSADRAHDFAVFQWLTRTARVVIAMDAFLGERTFAVLARIRGAGGAVAVINDWKNARDDRYFITSSRDQWLAALLECIARRERIVVCANSATEGRAINELLTRKLATRDGNTSRASVSDGAGAESCSNARVKFYCAETPTHTKRRDFADVDRAWMDCEVLIYTPTLTAGVSFERAHFDRMFGYFTDRSCGALTCIQMMGRIRDITQRQAFICLSTTPGSLPETREEMILCLRLRKGAILSRDLPDVEYTDAGLPRIPDTDYAELRVQNAIARNRSRNAFADEFARAICSAGARAERLTPEAFARIFGRAVDPQELGRAHDERVRACAEVTERMARAIAEARELVGDEFMALAAARDNVSEDDRAAMRKYELRATYREHSRPLTPEFVMTFARDDLMVAFRNLRDLCDAWARARNNTRALGEMTEKDVTLRALTDIRAIEAAHMQSATASENADDAAIDAASAREFDFDYAYERHRLMYCCVTILGFESVFDPRMLAVREVESRVSCNLGRISAGGGALWRALANQFKVAPLRIGGRAVAVSTAGFIEVVRGVLLSTYAIALVRAGDLYHLEIAREFKRQPNGTLVVAAPP